MPATRRAVLGIAAAATALAASGRTASPSGLDAIAQSGGRRFGAATRTGFIETEADFAAALRAECGILTPEISGKWGAIQPEPDTWHFAALDALVEIAGQWGSGVHGHALLWHGSLPRHAASEMKKSGHWAIVEAYFDRVLMRYRNRITRWDVINEPVGYDDDLRPSPFLSAFGPDYIPRALTAARDRAPGAILCINEIDLEADDDLRGKRRLRLLRLAEKLLSSGVPLDAIGLQGHLKLSERLSPQYRRFVEEIAALGLSVFVTEMDVQENDLKLPVAVRDQRVADATWRFLEAVLASPAATSVTTWGLSDRHSWLRRDEKVPDHRLEADPWTAINRGLPLDGRMRPKPMYDAIAMLFRQAPRLP